jgi:hypothetical protein
MDKIDVRETYNVHGLGHEVELTGGRAGAATEINGHGAINREERKPADRWHRSDFDKMDSG